MGFRRDRKFPKDEVLRLLQTEHVPQTTSLLLPTEYDLTRIDMTGTVYEEITEHGISPSEIRSRIQRETIPDFDYTRFKKEFESKIQFFSDLELKNQKTLAEKILHIITSGRYRNGMLETIKLEKYGPVMLGKIQACIDKRSPIEIVLPAFPFKVRNPIKSTRGDADLAEVGAFLKFYEICLQIQRIYPEGAVFHIFHDGHLYYKSFLHEKSDADRYLKTLRLFLKKLDLERYINLLDASKELEKIRDFEQTRTEAQNQLQNLWDKEKLNNERVARIIQSAKANVNLSDIPYHTLYDITTLESWDLSPAERAIKEKINRSAELCAFEYMVTQLALEKTNFFETIKSRALRATVHPKEGQIGLYLVKRKTHLLPWMGVGILKSDGNISVRYESEVIDSGKYYPVYIKGQSSPFYYKEAETLFEGNERFKEFFDILTDNMSPQDMYWAFTFRSEYENSEVTDILKGVHKKLAAKNVDDRAICTEALKEKILGVYRGNPNIRIRSTEKEIPVGVIVLKDRVVNLLWGDVPSVFEIKSAAVVAQYRKFFEEIWKQPTAGRVK